jgi:flagellar hook-basal body complex protein FliE
VTILPIAFPSAPVTGVEGITGATAPTKPTGVDTDFSAVLASSVDQLQAAHSTADALGAQAATGDLQDVHDYMIASTEATLATDMVVTVRNKAVEAFNEIMRMQV